jgi:16S rRNA (uracil1498-N3)-methyltransferase
MKLHRFYVNPQDIELRHDFWLHDEAMLRQWNKVLRFQAGQEIVLFDGVQTDRLYRIAELKADEAHLRQITDLQRHLPKREIYLLWGMLKKDKNDWIIQKCTELGVSHFIPLITERCDKTDVSDSRMERWQKIAVEAAEQCGRGDIPRIRPPLQLETAILELKDKVSLFVADKGEAEGAEPGDQVGIFIGPEGGWSEAEKKLFASHKLPQLQLHEFTLRAETAAITAITKLLK